MGDDFADFARGRPDPELQAELDGLPNWEPDSSPHPANTNDARLDTICASSLAGRPVPVRQWQIPGLVPARTVTLLTGHGGLGKTTLLLQALMAKATGTPWLGRPMARGGALGLFAEDEADEIHRRLVAMAEGAGQDLSAYDELHFAALAGRDASLVDPDGSKRLRPTELYAGLAARARAVAARLLVLDPAADLFAGDEINRHEVRTFMTLLTRLAIDLDAAVILSAHPSREGLRTGDGYSGSTAWHNSARSLLYLTRPDDDDGQADADTRKLMHLKCNLGPLADPITLHWRAGGFQPEDRSAGIVAHLNGTRAKKAFLNALDLLNAQKRYVTDKPNSGNYAPRMMLGMAATKGLQRRDLELAMKTLFDMGTIVVETYGPPSRGRTRIVRSMKNAE